MRNPFVVAPLAALTSAALVASVAFAAAAVTPPPVVPFDPATATATDSSFFDEDRVILKGLDVTGIARYCDGAGAWLFDCDSEFDRPSPVPDKTKDPCDRIEPCEIGNMTNRITVAFVGDSHARQLKTTMDLVGKFLKWRIVSFTKSTCQLGKVDDNSGCQKRDELVEKRARAGEFDLVITAQSAGAPSTESNYLAAFGAILKSGTPVATFRDNPALDQAALDCKRINFSDPNVCSFIPETAYRNEDRAAQAASLLGMHIIDMSAVFCHDNVCPLAIGGLTVYRDSHHVNSDFSETLAPLIAANLAGARLIRTE